MQQFCAFLSITEHNKVVQNLQIMCISKQFMRPFVSYFNIIRTQWPFFKIVYMKQHYLVNNPHFPQFS